MPLRVGTLDFLAQAVGLRFRISIQEEAGKGPGEDRDSSGEPCVYHPEIAVLGPESSTCCKSNLVSPDFSIGADRIRSGLRFPSACQGRTSPVTACSGVFGRLQGLLP